MPSVASGVGYVGTAHDVFSLSGLVLPPFAAAAPQEGTGFLTVGAGGAPLPSARHQWLPYATRRWSPVVGGVEITVETRLALSERLIFVAITVNASSSVAPGVVNMALQALVIASASIPWTLPLPATNSKFTASLAPGPALVTCGTAAVGPARGCSAWAFAAGDAPPSLSLKAGATLAEGALPAVPAGGARTFGLVLAVGDDADATAAAARAAAAAFWAGFNGVQAGFEARWLDAFTPKQSPGDGHFSGSMPVLLTDDDDLSTLYYTSALALLQAERTNLPQFAPRTYLTASGGTAFDGGKAFAVGGTTQFAWDQAFYPTLAALLDPVAQREDLERWNGVNFSHSFGIETDTGALTGYFYAFTAISLWSAYSGYLRATNDTTLLALIDGPSSSTRYLEQLADLWRGYAGASPQDALFADYCSTPSCYLECLPTYIHATAGLQASNARMSRELGGLRAAQGNASAAAVRRAAADAIAAATIPRLYVAGDGPSGDVGGWWAVLDTATGRTTGVRHVIDFAYATQGFCPAGGACKLTPAMRAQMADFALRQLVLPGGRWIRALSVNDTAAPIPRPDHGSTGAYDAWPALLFSALTALDGGFGRSVPLLKGLADVARDAPYGQAKQVVAGGAGVIKPVNGWTRGLANNGAAFAEEVVKTLFGYTPPWLPGADGGDWKAALVPAFAGVPRGLRGVLAGIRLPDGTSFMNATLTPAGVEFSFY